MNIVLQEIDRHAFSLTLTSSRNFRKASGRSIVACWPIETIPVTPRRGALRVDFAQLFGQTSGYQQLDERLARTRGKERSVADGSFSSGDPLTQQSGRTGSQTARPQTRCEFAGTRQRGIAAWDTFQTLVRTAKKLRVNIYRYIHDRIAHTNLLPSLATLIQERADLLHLGASWAPTI